MATAYNSVVVWAGATDILLNVRNSGRNRKVFLTGAEAAKEMGSLR